MRLFTGYAPSPQILLFGYLGISVYRSGFGLTYKLAMTLRWKKTVFKTDLIKKCMFTQWRHKKRNSAIQKTAQHRLVGPRKNNGAGSRLRRS